MRRFPDEDLVPDQRADRWSPLTVIGWALFVPSLCLLILAYVWVYH